MSLKNHARRSWIGCLLLVLPASAFAAEIGPDDFLVQAPAPAGESAAANSESSRLLISWKTKTSSTGFISGGSMPLWPRSGGASIRME